MKRFVTAILPLMLIGQIPFHAANYVPSEWRKSLQYGLKWTELMMNGYPGVAEATDQIPEGDVTTTVTMAGTIPELEHFRMPVEEELCRNEINDEIQKAREEAFRVLVELKEERALEIRRSQFF